MAKRKVTVKTCDRLFSEYIHLRDKSCQRCHASIGKMDTAHFYSRSYRNIRFDPDNACLLCFKCHFLFAHREPHEFSQFWIARLGAQKFVDLVMRKNTYKKMFYEEEKLKLQCLINELRCKRTKNG